MDARIGAAAFFIDPGELTRNTLPHLEPALRGLPPGEGGCKRRRSQVSGTDAFDPGMHYHILAKRVLYAVFSFKFLFCVPSFALSIDYFSVFRG
jgi:hypothetical protein